MQRNHAEDNLARGLPMMRASPAIKGLVLIAVLFLIGALLLLVVGSVRYGGLDGLVRRVRIEIEARRSHPAQVPTPMAADALDVTLILPTEPPSVPPSPVPTSTPVIAESPDGTPSSTKDVSRVTSTATPVPTSTPTPSPTPAHGPALSSVELTGLVHMWQTWNNCGPATLAMNLSYFGLRLDQTDVGAVVRPNPEDKHAGAAELAAFARAQGFGALVRVNGDPDRLRLLLSNELPVMIATWIEEEEPGNGLGHYRLLTGYDDAAQEWIAYDSYISTGLDRRQPYRGIRLSYEEIAQGWAVYNHLYIVVYPVEREPVVRSILGPDYDDEAMWRRSLQSAQEAVQQRPEDAFAWFNLGTNLVAAEQFEGAAAAYDQARTIGLPWRMLWYQFGPFEAYYYAGRYEELLALARATIATTTNVEEVHYWLGMGLLAIGDQEGAAQAFRQALEKKPGYVEAAEALNAIGE
jgi:hypothetical protein